MNGALVAQSSRAKESETLGGSARKGSDCQRSWSKGGKPTSFDGGIRSVRELVVGICWSGPRGGDGMMVLGCRGEELRENRWRLECGGGGQSGVERE